MSPHYMINLAQLRRDATMFARGWADFERMLKNMNQRFRDVRNNERILVSRNKREGWYAVKYPGHHARSSSKEWALRYRKQTGAQVVRAK